MSDTPPDTSSRRRLAVTAGLVSFIAYAYFYQAGGWNQNSRFDLVRALVEDQTAAIDKHHRNTGDKACKGPSGRCNKANFARGEHYYCDKAPGASLLAAVGYAPIYWLAGQDDPSQTYLDWTSHAATVVSVALPSAIGVAMLLLLLLHLGVGRAGSLFITAAYAFGTLAFPYSTLLYGHQLAGALLIIGFALLVFTPANESGRAALARLAGAGFALGFAVSVEYPAALAVIAISPWVLWRFRRNRSAIAAYVTGGLLGGLAMFVYHWAVFGGPLVLPYEFVLMPQRHQGAFMGIGALSPEILWKVTFSAYRGLFYSAPWLLFAIAGALVWWVRGRHRAITVISVVITLLFLALNASVAGWHGGWTLGPRYLIPALPFMALLVAGCLVPIKAKTAPSIWGQRLAWLGIVFLGVLSMRNMVAATAVRPEVPQHVVEPFAGFINPHFARGSLAVNRQGIDQPAAPKGGERRAFNLGMKVGLEGKMSLLPLALLIFFLAVTIHQREILWFLVGSRRRRAPYNEE